MKIEFTISKQGTKNSSRMMSITKTKIGSSKLYRIGHSYPENYPTSQRKKVSLSKRLLRRPINYSSTSLIPNKKRMTSFIASMGNGSSLSSSVIKIENSSKAKRKQDRAMDRASHNHKKRQVKLTHIRLLPSPT